VSLHGSSLLDIDPRRVEVSRATNHGVCTELCNLATAPGAMVSRHTHLSYSSLSCKQVSPAGNGGEGDPALRRTLGCYVGLVRALTPPVSAGPLPREPHHPVHNPSPPAAVDDSEVRVLYNTGSFQVRSSKVHSLGYGLWTTRQVRHGDVVGDVKQGKLVAKGTQGKYVVHLPSSNTTYDMDPAVHEKGKAPIAAFINSPSGFEHQLKCNARLGPDGLIRVHVAGDADSDEPSDQHLPPDQEVAYYYTDGSGVESAYAFYDEPTLRGGCTGLDFSNVARPFLHVSNRLPSSQDAPCPPPRTSPSLLPGCPVPSSQEVAFPPPRMPCALLPGRRLPSSQDALCPPPRTPPPLLPGCPVPSSQDAASPPPRMPCALLRGRRLPSSQDALTPPLGVCSAG
jgi:hypothetical protein